MGDTPTEQELKEIEQEMRKRSHELANILQVHASELAVMKTVAEQVKDLGNAIYGDVRSGTDTGLRGAVAHLAQAVRDTEWQRQKDREREETQYALVVKKLEEAGTSENKRSGALQLIREILAIVSTMATVVMMLVAAYQLMRK